MKEIHTKIAKVYLGEDSIVHIDFKENAYETYETLSENALAINRVGGDKGDNLVVFDIKKVIGASKEARRLAKSKKYIHVFKAVGIVVGNPLTRMIASFFIGFSEPGFPVKIFEDKTSARNWLLENYRK